MEARLEGCNTRLSSDAVKPVLILGDLRTQHRLCRFPKSRYSLGDCDLCIEKKEYRYMYANKYCRKFEMQRVNVWWIWFIHATTFGGESKHLHPETLSFRCISCGFPISKLNIVTYSQLESNLSLGSVDSNVLSATASCFQQRTCARAMIYGTYRSFQSPSFPVSTGFFTFQIFSGGGLGFLPRINSISSSQKHSFLCKDCGES